MISRSELLAAAEAIRAGELVAFPTETVYGLGANALDPEAVARIYEAKGRPASSPLIVHVASVEQARELAADWPDSAQKLAELFWPGPLTLVVHKNPIIPDRLTGGLDTVGLRMPANTIALALIREAGVPLAAPSANRFTELSPTTAQHVRESLGDRVALILDGGPTDVGIESTVLAVSPPCLLRPGSITREQIESVIGPISVDASDQIGRSPGQHARHYQPRTRLVLARANELPAGRGAYLFVSVPGKAAQPIHMPADARAYAQRLYALLHELDAQNLDWIAVEPPPEGSEWDGIRDRLRRASAV
jgi:L-threonylcarbamoyladenylate synthase